MTDGDSVTMNTLCNSDNGTFVTLDDYLPDTDCLKLGACMCVSCRPSTTRDSRAWWTNPVALEEMQFIRSWSGLGTVGGLLLEVGDEGLRLEADGCCLHGSQRGRLFPDVSTASASIGMVSLAWLLCSRHSRWPTSLRATRSSSKSPRSLSLHVLRQWVSFWCAELQQM